jgi:hypothetical protein
MQKAINRLRLLVASIKGKEDEMDGLVRQFKRQLERAPRHAIHGGNPLETTLSIMGEIQERLDAAVKVRTHLDMINELERFIEDASNRAARAITDEFDVPHL